MSYAQESPSTEVEAMLLTAEALGREHRLTRSHLVELARFLGANSAAWTVANRARLRRTLAIAAADGGIGAILSMMRSHPRTDVLDEAELALRAIPPAAANYLATRLRDVTLAAIVRAHILRVLARRPEIAAGDLIREALGASEPEIREAAASLVDELE